MTTTPKTLKQGAHPCGFCLTNRHDLCPGGVLNGNLTDIYLCGCGKHDTVRRCLDCNTRSNEQVSESTWTCIDADACAARRDAKRREIEERLFGPGGAQNLPSRSEFKESAPRAVAAPKQGKCLHCGEPTKGGKFLPGHDAAYLSAAVKTIREHHNPDGMLTVTLEGWAAQGISEALQAKLTKRVNS